MRWNTGFLSRLLFGLLALSLAGATARARRLSRPPGAHHRRLSARRLDRHRRAPDRQLAEPEARPAIHRREQARRRQQYRHRTWSPRAAPDGYTLFLVNPANTINATLYKKLNFVFLRDIDPVAGFIQVPNVMEVNPSVPVKTVAEFIAYVKANPDKVNMASSGNGTSIHLSGELFKMMTGVKMTHVPYKGSAPMLTDLLGGQVQVTFDNLPSSIGHIKAGKLRALAVTTAKRSPELPDVPTVAETVPGYEASAFFGIGAPHGTPKEIVDAAQQGDQRGAQGSRHPGASSRISAASPMPGTPEDFGKFLADRNRQVGKGRARRQPVDQVTLVTGRFPQ